MCSRIDSPVIVWGAAATGPPRDHGADMRCLASSHQRHPGRGPCDLARGLRPPALPVHPRQRMASVSWSVVDSRLLIHFRLGDLRQPIGRSRQPSPTRSRGGLDGRDGPWHLANKQTRTRGKRWQYRSSTRGRRRCIVAISTHRAKAIAVRQTGIWPDHRRRGAWRDPPSCSRESPSHGLPS